ncbi:chorismate synthase [soil metagenome]
MAALTYITAGESHGAGILAVVSGMPTGVAVDIAFIDGELARRQGGYGRSGRQRIEHDRVEILSGVRRGVTTGAPVTLMVRNADSRLDDLERTPGVSVPRPGHADFAGSVKYWTTDCRDTLERASARETAGRVAAGALARVMLREMSGEMGEGRGAGAAGSINAIESCAFVRAIGGVEMGGIGGAATRPAGEVMVIEAKDMAALRAKRDGSETYCPDEGATAGQREAIRQAKIEKTTLGGVIECHVLNVPPGIGSTMHWFERLDARLAGAVMGVQAIKGVEIGAGFEAARRRGHEVHDALAYDAARRGEAGLGFVRATNRAGGIEGGMSNGAPIVLRAAMKPISTLLRGMASVELNTKDAAVSVYERSDICAAPAASVVIENVVAFEIARAVREKFGGDSIAEAREQYRRHLEVARTLPLEGQSRGADGGAS